MENPHISPPEWITDPTEQERWYEGRDDRRANKVNASTLVLILENEYACCAYEDGYRKG